MRGVKPNGERLGTFVVSIDDGWVEYSYRLRTRGYGMCVEFVWQALRKALGARGSKATMRTLHKDVPAGTLGVWKGRSAR